MSFPPQNHQQQPFVPNGIQQQQQQQQMPLLNKMPQQNPPGIQQINKIPPFNPNQQQFAPRPLLANGNSTTSSRTSSPGLNQSMNDLRLNNIPAGQQMRQQQQQQPSSQGPPNMNGIRNNFGSTQQYQPIQQMNPHVPNLIQNHQPINNQMTMGVPPMNGPPPPNQSQSAARPNILPQQQFQPTLPSQTPGQYIPLNPQPPQYAQQNQQQQPPVGLNKRPMYPQQPPQQQQQMQQQQQPQQQFNQYPGQNVDTNYNNGGQLQYQPQSSVKAPMNTLWGNETIDLMQNRHLLPTTGVKPPPIVLNHQFHESVNCNPDIFRCTLSKIPESNNLLQKSRLPLGILIHPFRDLTNLPVVQCSTIVRCRNCRTYINPFVYFVDSKKWRCNICHRVNDLPEEFQYDPASKTYGDVTRRPEIKSSTIEFIAPSEYMLRPPQPAMYLFLLDVSILAVQTGYLKTLCDTLSQQLDNIPGDARTQIGFIAYNSALHFYSMAEGFNQPHEITVLDIDDIFVPTPDNLLVNLKENRELINDLLEQIPKRFENSHDPGCALGAALQVAFKMMSMTGGRVSVFQTCLPNAGPGALQPREDPNNRSAKEVAHLGPATDFYKRLALDCSGQQVAVDLFLLNSQYSDLATLSGISKFSGGCINHFPLYSITKKASVDAFTTCLERYLTRKIGFEAVMRVRCSRGLAIHTFHGNFFVRSTDLLSLPNVNPDAGYGMQLTYEETLTDIKTVCFQAALLYTSSKGERRIRVHTLNVPIVSSLQEVMYGADVHAILGLLTKMAVDRSLQSNLPDARDAFINATVDMFAAFKLAQNLPSGQTGQLVAPQNLALLPLYIHAIMKHNAFRTGTSTRLDDRVFAMCEMKSLPLDQLIRYIYADFYQIDCLFGINGSEICSPSVRPPRYQLSAERLDSRSIFMMDCGVNILLYVGSNVHPQLLQKILGITSINEVPDVCYDLPKLDNPESDSLNEFINSLCEDKPFRPTIQIIKDTSTYRAYFTEKLVDDRSECSLSYYEFLQHLRTQVK